MDKNADQISLLEEHSIEYTENIESLKETLNNFKNYPCLTINNCPSIFTAKEFISNYRAILPVLDKLPSVIAIRFKVNEKFDPKYIEKAKTNEFEFCKTFLVYFESVDGKVGIIHWRNENNSNFNKLELHDESFLNSFVVEFFIESLKEKGEVTSISEEFHLTSIINHKYENLLTFAVEKEKIEVVRKLLSYSFDVNEEVLSDENDSKSMLRAVDIAWAKNNQDIVLELLKANSLYPKKFDKSKANNEINKFLKISETLHERIESKDLSEIKKIIENNKEQQYFFNSENISAFKKAFRLKQSLKPIEVYKILYENNLTFGPNEDIKKCELLNIYEKYCKINSQLAWSIPERHIFILLSKSVIPRTNRNFKKYFEKVKESFEILNEIPEISLPFQIIATSHKTKIHFDFTQDSVMYMNPRLNPTTRGVFTESNHHIHIAAKGLLKSETKSTCYGTIAHEPCHSCMNIVFMNMRQPFGIDDEENKLRFMAIVNECDEKLNDLEKNNKQLEPIVDAVYGYDQEVHATELIVRVPHMLAFYHDNEEKIRELKTTFKSLFDYYDEIVMPAMKKSLPVLEKISDLLTDITFDELTEPLKSNIKNSTIVFQGKELKFKEIANFEILNQLNSKNIRKILNGKKLIIGKSTITSHQFFKERKFIDTNYEGKYLIWNYDMEKRDGKYEYSDEIKAIVKDFDMIYSEAKETKIFLLSDGAGAGKTTMMEQLAIKIKENCSRNWIAIIDLKSHLGVYEKYKNEKFYLNSSDDEKLHVKNAIVKILIEIFSLVDEFEMKVFEHLFMTNCVVLLFDGFDEIAPKFEEFFITLIVSINKLTDNQQWIATRPQHDDNLKQKFSQNISYKLLPFDENETKNFITEYMRFQSFSGDYKIIMKLIDNLRIFQNALMLTMIVDLYIAGRLSIENFNNFSLYEATIELKKDILAKKGEIPNRDSNINSKCNLWEVHQIYALKTVLNAEQFEDFFNEKFFDRENSYDKYDKKMIDISQLQIFKKWKKEKLKWSAEAISRSGFLTIFNWNTDKEYNQFIHRTYAEFFVAVFLIENITEAIEEGDELNDNEFEMRMKLATFFFNDYCKSESTRRYEVVHNFIFDFLSSQSKKIIFCEKFYDFLERAETSKFIQNIFCESIFETNHYYFASSLLRIYKNDIKIINALLCIENNRSKLFQIAINHKFPSHFCELLFGLLRNTEIENWHYLTGFGLNLTQDQLNLPTYEELEKYSKDDILTKNDMIENYKGGIDELSIFTNEHDLQFFKLLLQFFSFIANVDDFEFEKVEKFLLSLIIGFPLMILRSEKNVETFFQIVEKYFKNKKERFINLMDEFNESRAFVFLSYEPFKYGSKILKNFGFFYSHVKNFLKFDSEIVKKVLSHKHILCFAIAAEIDSLKETLKEVFDKNELNEILLKVFTEEYHCLDTIKKLKNFEKYCSEISEFSNIFQFFVNNCYNLDFFFNFFNYFKQIYDKECHKYTGYELKIPVNKKIMIKTDKLEEKMKEIFPIDEIKENWEKSHTTINQKYLRKRFMNFHYFLCLIEKSKIPKSHLDNFFSKNFTSLLLFANSHNILINKLKETLINLNLTEFVKNLKE
ncbi:hypothetical protein PVAND_008456 [Polypedilum vanderplanki]|uniref:NACHT domain-containing protein n=1 Tax=Polypedilum vanderplanki TaxID=319348 RepID=A0A9J6CB47_POLVA|nr:hypothetical protein PVAND_008456 [Polypedilum vanderplanki]